MEETISRMAGSAHGVRQSPEALEAAARAVGRPVAQRTTDYRSWPMPRSRTAPEPLSESSRIA
jgi:FO synthase